MMQSTQSKALGVPLRLRASAVKATAIALALTIVGLAMAWPGTAAAHPLGNFTINRYARLEPGADAVRIVYALDMAEIPTFQEMDALDRNRDKLVSEDEKAAYLQQKLPELARGLRLSAGSTALALKVTDGALLTVGEGQGGLPLLRIDAVFVASLPDNLRSGVVELRFQDSNFSDRQGWKEIVVHGTAGAAVRASNVSATDVSNALRAYPNDALQSPLEVREATFTFEPGVADAGGTDGAAARVAERTKRATGAGFLGRFAESAGRKDVSLPVGLALMAMAMFWGALHALGPGHGKTVVAAYLVGQRGTARHAIFLGLTVTATHTAGVYLLGFITLSASHFIVPERLYPFLSLSSGLLVVGMGLWLLRSRLQSAGVWPFRRAAATIASPMTAPAAAPMRELVLAGGGNVHQHGGSVHTRDGGEHPHAAGPHDHHHYDYDHGSAPHAHGAGDHAHADGPHAHDDSGHTHSHGFGPAHSHAIPGADGSPVTWRNLLALGIYGGLIPCPTAIVVLLTSISLNRVGFGLLLVVAFSAGLAMVLTGVGIMLVYAGRIMNRLNVSPRIATAIPIASAALVIVAGLVITLRTAGQTWLPGV